MNNGKPIQQDIDTLKTLNTLYDRKSDRGLAYKFMWVNTDEEKAWATYFKYENTPKVVVIIPGKRKRVLEHEGAINV